MYMDRLQELILNKINSGIILLDEHLKIEFWNSWIEQYTGITSMEVIGKNVLEIIPALKKNYYIQILNNALETGQNMFCSGAFHPIFLYPSNYDKTTLVKQNLQVEPIFYNQKKYISLQIIDITNQFVRVDILKKEIASNKQAEKALKESEEKYRLLITQMQQGIAVYEVILDQDGNPTDYRFIDTNESYERLTGLKRECIIGKTLREVIPLESAKEQIMDFNTVAMTGEPLKCEVYEKSINKYLEKVVYSPRPQQFAVIISDITDRKMAEQQILHLSYHDQLTGVYNRRFYEEALIKLDKPENLPLSIIMADVNGLKLINDSFGHAMGDELIRKVAKAITKGCRADDIIARLGGDEFIVILQKTDAKETERIIRRIKGLIQKETIKTINISISFGYETKTNEKESFDDLFKKAEDHMYKHKLFESPSMRGRTVQAIINTLHEKNKREEQHSMRVSELCKNMALALNLNEHKIEELKTVGLLHDIGKVAIEENILNKPGTLTSEEREEINRHSEIGYRIMSAVNDLSDIAEYVLYHHEKWDGTGYPKGLKKNEIPLESRIISIVDAFDAMTSERSYRRALSEDIAVCELESNSGSQFDPELVNVFVQKILGKTADALDLKKI